MSDKRRKWQKVQVENLISKRGSERVESLSKMRKENEGVIVLEEDIAPSPMEIAHRLGACSITDYLIRTDFPKCALNCPVMVNGVVGYLKVLDRDGKMFAVLEESGKVHIFETQRLRNQFDIVPMEPKPAPEIKQFSHSNMKSKPKNNLTTNRNNQGKAKGTTVSEIGEVNYKPIKLKDNMGENVKFKSFDPINNKDEEQLQGVKIIRLPKRGG